MVIPVEKSVYGGDSLCRVNGMTVFVPFTIPGETVDIDILQTEKGFSYGTVKKITEQSKDRIDPKCLNFGKCGGCSYLHMSYERELAEKKNIIIDSITRIGKIKFEEIPDIETISAERFHYRSHAVLKSNGEKIGFFGKKTNSLVPLPDEGCVLLSANLNSYIKKYCAEKIQPTKNMWIAEGHSGIASSSIEHKKNIVVEKENGLLYQRDADCFFQGNSFLRGTMLAKAIELCSLNGTELILDMGCGVGFFALGIARENTALKVTGIDINGLSIDYAVKNAALNSIKNACFRKMSFDKIHPYREKYDIIIADPPRAGIMRKARETMVKISPEKIIYISCNPATWSRDVNDFLKNGYRLRKIYFIDMFPGTHHIELISLISK